MDNINAEPRRYRSGRPLARVITALVVAQGVLVQALMRVDPETAPLFFPLTFLLAGAAVAALVCFCMWLYRVTANLRPLGHSLLRYSPALAVWSLFIPAVNLALPYFVMCEVWKNSQPRTYDELGRPLSPRTGLITLWWIAWLVGRFTTHSGVMVLGFYPLIHLSATGGTLWWLLESALFVAVVWRTTRRQDDAWQDIVLRAALPEPAGDRLR